MTDVVEIIGIRRAIAKYDGYELVAYDFTISNTINSNSGLKVKNKLATASGPLTAIQASYTFENIDWYAGDRWPNYIVPAPCQYKVPGDTYPNLDHHCIVFEIGGEPSNTTVMQGGHRGNRLSEIYVMVNDDKYDDNFGSFKFSLVIIE